eukprot:1677134-Rhodomonas_salina.2
MAAPSRADEDGLDFEDVSARSFRRQARSTCADEGLNVRRLYALKKLRRKFEIELDWKKVGRKVNQVGAVFRLCRSHGFWGMACWLRLSYFKFTPHKYFI